MEAMPNSQSKREGGCGILLSVNLLCHSLDNVKREVLIVALAFRWGVRESKTAHSARASIMGMEGKNKP
jgi:hypothetical protein